MRIELRWRILAFLAVLVADVLLLRTQPWPMIVGVVAYLVIVYPAVYKRP